MEDFDFLLKEHKPNMYSYHDVYVDKFYAFDLGIYKSFPFMDWKNLITFGISCSYTNSKFAAQDGFLQYPVSGYWTGKEEKKNVSGTVLMYEISVLQPQLHVGLHTLSGSTMASVLINYAPYCFISTLDSHIVRQVQFFDKNNGSQALELEIRLNQGNLFYILSVNKTFFHKGISSSSPTGLATKDFVIDEKSQSGFEQSSFRFSVGLNL